MRVKLIILALFLFTTVKTAYAVSVTISNTPASITDQPFVIDIIVSGAQAGTNYLRANFFTAGTTKYFGFTNNGSEFINSSDYSQYFPITIDSSGTWSGSLQVKLDSNSNYFTGPGNYNLKVRRYTQSGSSYTWSNEVSLLIDFATPTPEPTSTPTPSPTPSPTQTPTQTPTPIPTTTPTTTSAKNSASVKPNVTTPPKTSSPLPTPSTSKSLSHETSIINSTLKPSANIDYNIASVAGATTSALPEIETIVKNKKPINLFNIIGLSLVFAGIGSLGYIYWKTR